MDWANATKIHTPSICQTLSPPDEHALYKGNFATGNGELWKVIADMKTAAQERKSFFLYFKSANLSKSLLKLTL